MEKLQREAKVPPRRRTIKPEEDECPIRTEPCEPGTLLRFNDQAPDHTGGFSSDSRVIFVTAGTPLASGAVTNSSWTWSFR